MSGTLTFIEATGGFNDHFSVNGIIRCPGRLGDNPNPGTLRYSFTSDSKGAVIGIYQWGFVADGGSCYVDIEIFFGGVSQYARVANLSDTEHFSDVVNIQVPPSSSGELLIDVFIQGFGRGENLTSFVIIDGALGGGGSSSDCECCCDCC